jgi:hypothetical protein
MMRLLAIMLASGLTIAGGLVHGMWTDRWGQGAVPAAAFAQFEDLPLEIGDWEGEPVDRAPASAPDVAGSMQRRYVNPRTGEAVILALVCGRPGPVAVHTPDACYVASGFTVSTPARAKVPGREDAFWTAEAVRSRATEETRLRIYWGWSAGQGWSAPDSPRTAFARVPVLHKLYVVREAAAPLEPGREDPCLAFLQAVVPALDRALFAPPS